MSEATPRGDSASAVDDHVLPVPDDFASCGTWHVAHCKSRMEKLFVQELAQCEVACFLPVSSRISFATGKRHVVREPLFPGYAFFAGDQAAIQQAHETRRLVMMIPVIDQAPLIRDLLKIKRAIEADPMLSRRGVTPGRRCRVIEGPLMGCEGIVERLGARSIVVIRIDILGQSVACDVPEACLEIL